MIIIFIAQYRICFNSQTHLSKIRCGMYTDEGSMMLQVLRNPCWNEEQEFYKFVKVRKCSRCKSKRRKAHRPQGGHSFALLGALFRKETKGNLHKKWAGIVTRDKWLSSWYLKRKYQKSNKERKETHLVSSGEQIGRDES